MRRLFAFLAFIPLLAAAQDVVEGSKADEPMVELKEFSPRIVVGLRYATTRNLAKRQIYPANARAFVREGVAVRLLQAQHWLDEHAPKGTRLKIWDAYRPAWAQKILWQVLPNKEYLGDPSNGGSLHTWGTCVDATLVDITGRELKMPTDFDVISPKAKTYYAGHDSQVATNVALLQKAMSVAGFYVVYDEWWHFVAKDWKAYAAVDMSLTRSAASQQKEASAQ